MMLRHMAAMALIIGTAGAVSAQETKDAAPTAGKEETICRAAPSKISRPGKRRLCLTEEGWEKIYARYPEFSRMTKKDPPEIAAEKAAADSKK